MEGGDVMSVQNKGFHFFLSRCSTETSETCCRDKEREGEKRQPQVQEEEGKKKTWSQMRVLR